MSRNPPRKEPRRPAVAARSEHADLDPRVVVVDPTFAATLTTRHTRSFVVTLARSDAGVDEFTRAIPNVGEALLEHLDADGLATPGSPVRPGTILVGKRTPTPGEPSPEEKLLRAIFGETVGPARDSSLRAPPRCFGAVASAGIDGDRAEVVVAWDRPLEVGDVLLVDGEPLAVAEIRPLGAEVARAGGGAEVSIVKGSIARDELIARAVGPYEPLCEQPIRDADGLAGQVVSADAIAALAGAAPWAAWELLTIKADSVTARLRVFEALTKGDRPDVAPRAAGPAVAPGSLSRSADIFSFFEPAPAVPPEHAPALQPEVVRVLALHLRALGLEVDPRLHAVSASFLSPAQLREMSYGALRGPDDLASQKIFGPVRDYACACGKYQRMRHRGVVCEVCGVEVIQSRARRERCGHIELATPCMRPRPAIAPRGRRSSARAEAPAFEADAPPLEALLVLPPGLRGPALDDAYARVLAADADALQGAVDELFAAIADVIETSLHPRMYAKAVDYSGAAQVVVDASLAAGACRLPRSLLCELFRAQAYALLERHGYATTIRATKQMVDEQRPEALAAIAAASEDYPVLLIAGAKIVARRVTAWDAPAIGVDAATAELLDARVLTVHVPVSHEAAVEVAALVDRPHAAATRADGWLARARRDGQLVAAAVAAARSGEVDPVADPVVHLALGRAPEPVDASALEAWQTAQEARQRVIDVQPEERDAGALLDRLVDELELSVRTANALQGLGIVTLRDLCARSEADLLRDKEFGRKSVRELKDILGELGLSLAATDA